MSAIWRTPTLDLVAGPDSRSVDDHVRARECTAALASVTAIAGDTVIRRAAEGSPSRQPSSLGGAPVVRQTDNERPSSRAMRQPRLQNEKRLFRHPAVVRTPFVLDETVVDFMMCDAYSPRMYDSNLNWVKVTVARPEEVDRVHAAISEGLHRSHLRPPIGDVIVVEFGDRHKTDGAEAVRHVIEEEFGSRLDQDRGRSRQRQMDLRAISGRTAVFARGDAEPAERPSGRDDAH